MPSILACWLFGHKDVRDYSKAPRRVFGFTGEVPYFCIRCERSKWKTEAA